MGNKIAGIMAVLIIASALTTTPASAATPRYLSVKSIQMKLEGPDATFTVDYELDIIARLYVLFLGSGNIEPAFDNIFLNFNDYKIVTIRNDHAVIAAKNVSYKQKEGNNFYFHDSVDLGVTVETFYLVFPSGTIRTFHNFSSTPNTFFEE